MATFQDTANYYNFLSTNEDYPGYRTLNDTQEDVNYHAKTRARIWLNYQEDNFASHWHTAMEIIVPVENYYDVTAEGQDYHLMPGEILIIPPGDLHEIFAPDTGRRFIYLFDVSLISGLKGYSNIAALMTNPAYLTSDSHPFVYNDIYDLLVQIRNEYFSMNEYSEMMIYSLLLTLLVKFGEDKLRSNASFPNSRLDKQKEYIQKFNELIEYIDTHYMEDISLDSAANTIGFSKYHFSRLFKQYTNSSFCDYVNQRRIKAAEELLGRRDLSITEVSYQAGFPSISSFNRLFRLHKNCTPSEFRARRQIFKSPDDPYNQ